MTRWVPRFSLGLTKAILTKAFLGSPKSGVLRIDLSQFAAGDKASDRGESGASAANLLHELRDGEVLAEVRRSNAPFLWIDGDTPLKYERVGQLANAAVRCGKTVFVESDATFLRRRIHEFRPVSRLYLVLPLHGVESEHDRRAGAKGNFRLTLESIRTARLSGFHICVETPISTDMGADELRELTEFIAKLGVDGWVLTRHRGEVSAEVFREAVRLLPARQWRMFSELLDDAVRPGPLRATENACGRVAAEVRGGEEGLRAQ
jgi:hypothetical protein